MREERGWVIFCLPRVVLKYELLTIQRRAFV
jgi:hypothetical protein